MVYLLLVVYIFLPIPYKWQAVLLAALLTAGDLALNYYAISSGHLDTEHEHIVTKVGGEAWWLLEGDVVMCVYQGGKQ